MHSLLPSFRCWLLSGLLALLALAAHAQTWELLDRSQTVHNATIISSEAAQFEDVAQLANGDALAVGWAGQGTSFAGAGALSAIRANRIQWAQGVVVRYNSRTQQWSQLVQAATPTDSEIRRVIALPGGDALVIGRFRRDEYGNGLLQVGTLQLGTATLPVPMGRTEGFVARLDGTTGACRWLTPLESVSPDDLTMPCGLALRGTTEAVVVGYFTGQMKLGNLPALMAAPPASMLPYQSVAGADLFVARLDLATGQWVQGLRAGGAYSEGAAAVVALPGGDVVVAVSARGPQTFGSLPTLPGKPSVKQAFVARLDPVGGQWRWAQAVQADSSEISSLTVLPNGNIAALGYYVGSARAGALVLPPGLEQFSTLVACFTPAGQWQWLSSGGGSYSQQLYLQDEGFNRTTGGLAATPSGNLIVTSIMAGQARFGQLPVLQVGSIVHNQPYSQSGFDIYVGQLDGSTGRWQWLTQAGTHLKGQTSRGYNWVGGLQVLNNQQILVVGSLDDGAYLGSDVGPFAISANIGDEAFLARLTVPAPCPDSTQPAPPSIQLALDSAGCTSTATLRVTGAPYGSDYHWSTGTTGPTLTVSTPGRYSVRVHTLADCHYQLQAEAAIPTALVLANVITPNGDGLNDRWRIPGLPAGTHLRVYSRWGQLVYQAENYAHDWAAEGLPGGIYYYVLENDKLCVANNLRGWVEVVR